MPERSEISEFCQKVSSGDITVEYETHYVEFDDYGHFHDDWEHDYYDPDHAMTFISSVIRGCHDLIVLEDYKNDAGCVAEKIVKALEKELFEDCKTYSCITITEKDPLLTEIKNKLKDDLDRYEKEFADKSKMDKYYWGEYRDRERMKVKMLELLRAKVSD